MIDKGSHRSGANVHQSISHRLSQPSSVLESLPPTLTTDSRDHSRDSFVDWNRHFRFSPPRATSRSISGPVSLGIFSPGLRLTNQVQDLYQIVVRYRFLRFNVRVLMHLQGYLWIAYIAVSSYVYTGERQRMTERTRRVMFRCERVPGTVNTGTHHSLI